MKNLDLTKMGVSEMKPNELKDVNGGFWGLVFLGICALAGYFLGREAAE